MITQGYIVQQNEYVLVKYTLKRTWTQLAHRKQRGHSLIHCLNVADPLFLYKATYMQGGISALLQSYKSEPLHTDQCHCCARACASNVVLLLRLPQVPEVLRQCNQAHFFPGSHLLNKFMDPDYDSSEECAFYSMLMCL